MNNYEITFMLENGFKGTTVVPAINTFMAWDVFESIADEYDSRVVDAECKLVLENDNEN